MTSWRSRIRRRRVGWLPGGEGGATAPGAQLLGEELPGEGVRHCADTQAEAQPEADEEDDGEVGEGGVGGRELQVLVKAEEQHVGGHAEAAEDELRPPVAPGHDEGGDGHPQGEAAL